MEDLREHYYHFRNWVYRIINRCPKCGLQTEKLIRTEDGPHLCLPCMVKFNQNSLNNQTDTYLCLTCGCYYHQRKCSELPDINYHPTNLLYCDHCLRIQSVLQNYKFKSDESSNESSNENLNESSVSFT